MGKNREHIMLEKKNKENFEGWNNVEKNKESSEEKKSETI